MSNAKYFDENVIAYDKYRPTYGTAIFKDIIEYTGITTKSHILEIGCGTGNATMPFIKTGAEVTAIELGKNLSDFTAYKFIDYSNFKVLNMPFEDYETNKKYDLIFSATAFHWIKSDYGYPRCRELLSANGVLAVFWNTPCISDVNQKLKEELHELYKRYLPDDADDNEPLVNSQWYKKRCNDLDMFLEHYFYNDRVFKLYSENRIFTADEYIGLLHTYSNHMALPENTRNEFFNNIHSIISEFGSISLTDTIDLHMGRVKTTS